MQTEQQGEAEAKFWETPELLERLLSTLDLDSTFSLARVMNKEILKRSMTAKVWTTLVRQSFETMVIPDVPSDDKALSDQGVPHLGRHASLQDLLVHHTS